MYIIFLPSRGERPKTRANCRQNIRQTFEYTFFTFFCFCFFLLESIYVDILDILRDTIQVYTITARGRINCTINYLRIKTYAIFTE